MQECMLVWRLWKVCGKDLVPEGQEEGTAAAVDSEGSSPSIWQRLAGLVLPLQGQANAKMIDRPFFGVKQVDRWIWRRRELNFGELRILDLHAILQTGARVSKDGRIFAAGG